MLKEKEKEKKDYSLALTYFFRKNYDAYKTCMKHDNMQKLPHLTTKI